MSDFIGVNWFKKILENNFSKYIVEYKYFKNGDFGSLERVEFNNENKGGYIDYWSQGYTEFHLVDYISEEELMYTMIKPEDPINSLKEATNTLMTLI